MHRMPLVLPNKMNRNAGGAVRVVFGGVGEHQNGAESLGLTAPSWDDCTELGKRPPASSLGGAVKQHGASAPRGNTRFYFIFFPGKTPIRSPIPSAVSSHFCRAAQQPAGGLAPYKPRWGGTVGASAAAWLKNISPMELLWMLCSLGALGSGEESPTWLSSYPRY